MEESSSFKSSDDDSFQIKIGEERDKLIDENARLLKENTVLKAQFEHAVGMVEQSCDYQRVIQEMTIEVRKLKEENKSLNQRLEISSRTIKEIKDQQEEEKRKNNEMQVVHNKMMNNELDNLKKEYLEKVDSLNKEADDMRSRFECIQSTVKTLEAKNAQIVQAASFKYEKSFHSSEELISFLNEEQKISHFETPIVVPENNKKDEKKNKKYKRIIKGLEKEKYELNQYIDRSNHEQSLLSIKFEHEISSYRNKLDQSIKDNDDIKADFQKQILVLKERVQSLQEEKSKIIEQKPLIMPAPIESQLSMQTPDKSAYNDLKAKQRKVKEELLDKIEILTKQCNQLSDKLYKSEQRNIQFAMDQQKLTEELQNTKNELKTTKKSHIDDTKNNQNIQKENPDIKKEKKKEIRALIQAKDVLEEQINVISNQNNQLLNQNYLLKKENEELKFNISSFEKIISEQKQTIDTRERDFRITNEQLESIKLTQENDQIPSSAFFLQDFGSSLNSSISQIVNTPALQNSSKIQNIVRVIHRHYNAIIKSKENEITDTNLSLKQMKMEISDFISELSIIFNGHPYTVDTFKIQSFSSAVLEPARRLQSEMSTLRYKFEASSKCMALLQTTFGFESDDHQANIAKLKTDFLSNKELISSLQLKVRKNKSELKRIKNEQIMKNSSLEFNYKELEATNATLHEDCKRLKESFNDSINKIRELNLVINENKRFIDETTRQFEEEKKKNRENSLSEIKNLKFKYESEIQVLKLKIDELSHALDDEKARAANLKHACRYYKNNNEKNTKELSMQINESHIIHSAELDRQCVEHNIMVETLNEDIETLTKQNKSLSDELNHYKEESEKSCKTIEHLQSKIRHLKQDIQRIEEQSKIKIEEYERSSKLSDANSKATIMQYETKLSSMINELKMKIENEKRTILSFVIDEFRQYFDPNENIDDASFKKVVFKAKESLNKYKQSDSSIRRLIGVSNSQTTEDAIAELILRKQLFN